MRKSSTRIRFGIGAAAIAGLVFLAGCASVGSDGQASQPTTDDQDAVAAGVDIALLDCVSDEIETVEEDEAVNGVLPASRRARIATAAVHNCLISEGLLTQDDTNATEDLRVLHECLFADADQLDPNADPRAAVAACMTESDIAA